MDKLFTLTVALVCLVYYVKSNWPGIKDRPVIMVLLVGGILIFVAGVALSKSTTGPTLRLLGTCIFFTGVAIDAGMARKKNKDKN
ncbi:MAG TPA: hypothetical protein VHQ70_09525 [Syntrophomonadaceae bacterium]|nr:hypothetical protein [Syntrophomonadaceae bacterium]